MKPINIDTVAKSIAGWVYDFKNDNDRFPLSLEDLAENKNPRHDYNPKKIFELNQKLGFITDYILIDENKFELTVKKDKSMMRFSSDSETFKKENI